MNTRDPLQRPRRFYQAVSTLEAEDGTRILLDGRPARTPRRSILALPSGELAQLVAEEWARQGETLDLLGMGATRLARTAIDSGEAGMASARESLLGYAANDLICYFAAAPRTLVERQEQAWTPLLDWARERLTLSFVRTAGVMHVSQSPSTLTRLARMLEAEAPFALTGLAAAAGLLGSTILALAMREGRLSAGDALATARLDEVFQEEQWGPDAEAMARAEAMAGEAVLLERWFAALPSRLVIPEP